MRISIRHKAVLALGSALVVTACGSGPYEVEIEATVEATVLSSPAVTHAATVIPIPVATSTPIPPALWSAVDEIKEDVACTLSGGEIVQKGWSGNDTGSNYCNQCRCLNPGLACTKMACPSVKLPAAPTSEPTQVPESD